MATTSLSGLQAFQAVAQEASFTKAAIRLGLDKSKVSRDVRGLEERLGATLLIRSTRSVRLTAEGEAFLAKITPLLSGLEQAVLALPDRAQIPAGEVVLTTTPEIGRELLARPLVRFRAQYPAVRVRLILAERVVDLLGEAIDLAVRVGRPGTASWVARKIGDLEAGFFAAPAYLTRRGRPVTPRDLSSHDGLWPRPPKGRRSFAPADQPPPPAIDCADFGLLAAVARAGGGVALLPTFLAAQDVAQGQLLRVLPELSFMNAPLYLVSRQVRGLAPRVKALRQFLLEQPLL